MCSFGVVHGFFRFGFSVNMCGEFLSVLCLVERTVECGEEEHECLGAHSGEKHEVGARQVGEFEEGTKNHD